MGAAGFRAYLVGGAIRNMYMNRPVVDYDLATNATPRDVKGLFRKVIPTGEKHGTVTVVEDGHSVEVTTFRTESTYSDSRRPDAVSFAASIEEDLSRRDFSMNAIAMSLPDGAIVDPFQGRDDIKRKIIRAIGRAEHRFDEDVLRVLRAVRFSAQLGFTIEEDTRGAMKGRDLSLLSAERVREEFSKILSADAVRGFILLKELSLFEPWFVELGETVGQDGGGPSSDLYWHLVGACALAPAENSSLRLAALLHDIGKPRTRVEEPKLAFPRHDEVSADMAETFLRRLKFPNKVIQEVSHLVRHHMFGYSRDYSDSAIRRLIARVGPESIHSLIQLRRIDIASKTGSTRSYAPMDELSRRVEALLDADAALHISDLAVTGNDLAEAGIPKGPVMGTVLRFLLETVIDDPAQNNRDTLLTIASRFYRQRIAKMSYSVPQDNL